MAKNNVSLGSKLGISNEVLDVIKSELVDTIYPVGAIYISYSSTSPATLFGGTWEAIQGRFLLAENTDYPAGSTGGEATHTLTTSEMPAHGHKGDLCAITSSGWGAATQGNFYRSGNAWNRIVVRGGSETQDYYGSGTLTVQNTGGGEAHNNMPPYLSVYMWRRTA